MLDVWAGHAKNAIQYHYGTLCATLKLPDAVPKGGLMLARNFDLPHFCSVLWHSVLALTGSKLLPAALFLTRRCKHRGRGDGHRLRHVVVGGSHGRRLAGLCLCN